MKNHVKYFEVLNAQKKKSVKSVLVQGKVEYTFDSYCKSYLLSINSGSITIPRHPKNSLQLIMPYILFEVFIYPSKFLTIELTVTDSDSCKRRLIFTQGKQVIKNTMHARLPNSIFLRNTWVNLYIDVTSIFNLCFPQSNFRSLEMIYISGTLKLRKIFCLLLPANEILHEISEFPRFPLVLQEVDCKSFPVPRPLYYSNSPIKITKNERYSPQKNIFSRADNSLNQLKSLKKEYIRGINLGARLFFRAGLNKSVEKNESHKRAENVLSRLESKDDYIPESIEADKKSWVDLVCNNDAEKKFKSPDFFHNRISQICQIRHFTPPFVNSKEKITYNPVDRHYDHLL